MSPRTPQTHAGVMVATLLALPLVGGGEPAKQYVYKLTDMPDLCQADPRVLALPSADANLSAPVAVSNALAWLDAHGYPELIDGSPTPGTQAALVGLLASAEYMNTDKDGTPPKRVVAGIERYFQHRNTRVHIATKGWRSSAARIDRVPDPAWMSASVHDASNTILNIGWYDYDARKNIYERTGGHYVTLAGYQQDDDRYTFYIHDPARRDGLKPRSVKCRLRPLREHATLRLQTGETQNARGFHELVGIRLKSDCDLAIIDGAIAFQLQR